MEQLVAELKKNLPFKETTDPGDIVLVAARQPQILLYAAVGAIVCDETRKAEWWHVTLHLLTMPIQTVVWTLRAPQFTGKEIFTMGGEERFIQAVRLEREPSGESLHSVKQTNRRDRGAALRVVK